MTKGALGPAVAPVFLHDLVEKSAALYPEQSALQIGSQILSYSELSAGIRECAVGLIGLGLGR